MIESRIDLTLRLRAGTVAGVRLASSRPTTVAAGFAGRPAAQVLALLPTLFSLCGTAQALAGLAAIEAAAAILPPPPQRAARRLLLLAETIAEHGTAIARDWPALAGAVPDLSPAKALRGALSPFKSLLYPAGDWRLPGGGGLRPDLPALAAALDAARTAIAALPIERLIGAIADAAPGFGRCAFHPMPEGGPPDLAGRIGDDAYLAAPDCAGTVFETGALARHHRHRELAGLIAAHGNGLLPRLAARRVELAEALGEMHRLATELTDCPASAAPLGDGGGIGRVEAARGLLVHRVELADGLITGYRILAPTEWNFHPRGALAAGLDGAAADHLEIRARALIAALDPCVACTLSLAE